MANTSEGQVDDWAETAYPSVPNDSITPTTAFIVTVCINDCPNVRGDKISSYELSGQLCKKHAMYGLTNDYF